METPPEAPRGDCAGFAGVADPAWNVWLIYAQRLWDRPEPPAHYDP